MEHTPVPLSMKRIGAKKLYVFLVFCCVVVPLILVGGVIYSAFVFQRDTGIAWYDETVSRAIGHPPLYEFNLLLSIVGSIFLSFPTFAHYIQLGVIFRLYGRQDCCFRVANIIAAILAFCQYLFLILLYAITASMNQPLHLIFAIACVVVAITAIIIQSILLIILRCRLNSNIYCDVVYYIVCCIVGFGGFVGWIIFVLAGEGNRPELYNVFEWVGYVSLFVFFMGYSITFYYDTTEDEILKFITCQDCCPNKSNNQDGIELQIENV